MQLRGVIGGIRTIVASRYQSRAADPCNHYSASLFSSAARSKKSSGGTVEHPKKKTPVAPASIMLKNVPMAKMQPRLPGALPPHHKEDGGFRNPWPSYIEYGPRDFIFRALPEMKRVKTYALPTVEPDWEAIAHPVEALQAMWIGHASFLVQSNGWNILTDPVFSKRASPTQWFGPSRYTPPACAIQQLPPVHMVLISHNHYDHCDVDSIRALLERETVDVSMAGSTDRSGMKPYSGIVWVCPLKCRPFLESCGVYRDRIVELDWWDSYIPGQGVGDGFLPSVTAGHVTRHWSSPAAGAGGSSAPLTMPRITCIPAQHQSARTMFDRNQTLWAGYVVETAASAHSTVVKFYFSGDTGYRSVPTGAPPFSEAEQSVPICPAFREMGELMGPMDLSLLPIGAYSPRWLMSSFHVSPEDAVDIHIDVKSKRSVAMHWGVFPLTDEPIEEPPLRLAEALRHKGIDAREFVAIRPGGVVGATKGALNPAHVVEVPSTRAAEPAATSAAPAESIASQGAAAAATQGVVPSLS